jgi:pyruvate dehydrogenase E2 component (dihydrolipoamide acetyltransferase)
MEFTLPEIGEGVQEGELIRWLVKPGDSVAVDQPLLEVMTDKATVEVPATEAGTVESLKANEGDMIKVGQVLAVIGAAGAAKAAPAAETNSEEKPEEENAASAEEGETGANLQAPKAPNGNGHSKEKGFGIFADEAPAKSAAAKVPAKGPSRDAPAPSPAGPYQSALENLNAQSVPAAPIVRAMAREAGVDLAEVQGTGPMVGGIPRVLESDLIKFLNEGSAAPASPRPAAQPAPQAASKSAPTPAAKPAPAKAPTKSLADAQHGHLEELEERKPLRGLRRLIAQGMVKSKYTAPHYSYVDEFECSDLVKLREQAKQVAEEYGIKFSYLPFVIKAVVAALKDFPIVNSSLVDVENGQELVMKKYYHIGFAVATNDGLIVPVIKHADQKSLLQIAKELEELSGKVRANKASPEELKGSTFTITSMGNLGGLFAMPIINYPEAGILGVYKIQEKPIVQNGQIVVGKTMTLSLSLDHRIVDGAVGSQFCTAIIERLKNPAKLLLENF